MDWEKIKDGRCPKCFTGILAPDGRMIKCEECDFKIRVSKIQDLIKGKQSRAYLTAITKYKSLKKRDQKNKEKKLFAVSAQIKERLANLTRMLAGGEITQQEYDKKTA